MKLDEASTCEVPSCSQPTSWRSIRHPLTQAWAEDMTSIHRLATGGPSSANSSLRRTRHPRSLLNGRLQRRTDDERSRGHYLGVPSRESATVSRETDLLPTSNWKHVAEALHTQRHTECRRTAYDNSMRGLHRRFGWLCRSGLSAPSGGGFPSKHSPPRHSRQSTALLRICARTPSVRGADTMQSPRFVLGFT